MEKINVLIITQQYSPEGNAFRISDMAKYMNNDNANVIINSPHPTIPIGTFKRKWKLSESYNIDGINVINLWTWQPKSSNPDFINRLAYYMLFSVHSTTWVILHHKKYDVILTSSPPIFVNMPGLFAKYLLHKPWITDVRDLWIDASVSLGFVKSGSFYENISRKYVKYCYLKTDLICVTTAELKKKILQKYPSVNAQKMVVVPNGVDIDRFYPCAHEKKLQMIYSGNVGYAQDLENVILAMKEVIKTYPLKFLIVGSGDIKSHLEAVVKENNLTDTVIFKGVTPRTEIPKLISESTIGVAPLKNLESLEYAIPTKVYEYMACGVPFIGCGKGEITNIANESKAGIIAENNPGSIAKSIINLLDNPEQRTLMGNNGMAYAKKYCDRKSIAQDLGSHILNISTNNSHYQSPQLDTTTISSENISSGNRFQ